MAGIGNFFFPAKGQIVNILGFAGYTTVPLSEKAVTDNM